MTNGARNLPGSRLYLTLERAIDEAERTKRNATDIETQGNNGKSLEERNQAHEEEDNSQVASM